MQSILDSIGNTPLVPIKRLNPNAKVSIYAKLESSNPGGSIKDRVALALVQAAERSGELTPEKTIIEATSGNTGIGLSMVCAVKGYRLMLLMPESASEERKRIMSAFGAEISLTPGHLSTDGAIEEAYRLAREQPERYVLMDQFNNPASIEAHVQGTAREIWEQTKGQVSHVVTALGTSGTAMGLAKGLKRENPGVQIIAVEPYAGHKIQGLKNMQASYPPGIYNKFALDRILRVDDEQAFRTCRELAAQEAVFAGMSSGAALAGALQLAGELSEGLAVVIFPDGGERYLSTPLFVPPSKQGIGLYSCHSRKQEYLDLQQQPVSVFVPGPGPESPGNLEDWRRLLFADVLVRYLRSKSVNCLARVGIADFDDQALAIARSHGQSQAAFSASFLKEVQRLSTLLGVQGLAFVAASSRQQDMVDICSKLLAKGRAYEKLRSVYYDVFRDPDYGKLAGTDLEKLSIGETVDLDDYAKANPRDFTLLKRASLLDLKLGEFIKTEWGNVRPSWYLQMAAAAGNADDALQVVLAGRSHQFPHLENLRALWVKTGLAAPGVWMLIQNVSAEQVPGLETDVDAFLKAMPHPMALRMWLLSISHRKPLQPNQDNLRMWSQNWLKVQSMIAGCVLQEGEEQGPISRDVEQMVYDLKSGFTDMLENDVSLYRFWPILFALCRNVNKRFSQDALSPAEAGHVLDAIRKMDDVLEVIDWERAPLPPKTWPRDLRELVHKREQAKKEKAYPQADSLRAAIQRLGYQVEDGRSGTRVYRIEH